MQYILTPLPSAVLYGFLPSLHRSLNGNLILNETEVVASPFLTGDLPARVTALKATLFPSAQQLKQYIKDNE